MTLRDVVKYFQHNVWLLLLVGVLAGMLAHQALIVSGTFPRYSAEAVIAVGGDAYRDVPDVGYLEMAEALMANYLEVAEMELVTGQVARALGGQLTTDQIAEALDVSRVEGTNLITIRATSPDPVLAATIANSVAAELAQLAPPRWPQFVLPVKSAAIPVAPDQTAWLPVILSVIAALLLAIGLLLLYEFVRQPIYSEAQAEALFGAPVIASLHPAAFWRLRQAIGQPWLRQAGMTWWTMQESCRILLNAHSPAADGAAKADKRPVSRLIVVSPPSGQARLAPRSAARPAPPARIIVITAAGERSPQALVATQLARQWAVSGERVLLVDLDLRRADASRAALSANPAEGFATLIDKPTAKIAGLTVSDGQPGSSPLVLPAGTPNAVPTPADEARAVDSFRQQLTGPLVVIVSAPPVSESAAAYQICRQTDLTLVVVQAGATPVGRAQDLRAGLNAGGARIHGVVVAHVPMRQVFGLQTLRRWIVSRLTPRSARPDPDEVELDQGDFVAG